MSLKFFTKYRSRYYPRALQAIVVLTRYITILALLSISYNQNLIRVTDVLLANEILNAIIVTFLIIPFTMLIRGYVIRCGKIFYN